MKNWHRLVIIGCIALAIMLRFWKLGTIPEGFHPDEAAYGYNAYSILKTGKDEYRAPFPLILKSFGDYKAAVYSYLAIPSIYFYGLTEWSVRVPSAVFGILFVLLTYFFVYRLSKNRDLALLSMVLATISSLGIFLSRIQSDPLVCITFFYFAVYCWFSWTDTKQLRYIILLAVSVFLSFYTYTVTRIFAVPFLFLIGITYWKTFDRATRRVFICITVAVTCFVFALYVNPAGTRLSQITVFSTANVQLPLDEEIREDGAQHQLMLVTRLLHNKVTAYGRYVLNNYTDYLSFRFLFQQASQPAREQIPNMGVLMLIECPFLLFGIYTVLHKKTQYGVFALLWFLLVPAVLSIVSDETPNIHRFFLALLPIHILVAVGIMAAIQSVKSRCRLILVIVISALFLINVLYFLHELFVHQPIHAPIYRNAADKELALYLKSVSSSYDIIVSQKILENILFYWPIDPAVYQSEQSPRDTDNAWYRNIFFVTDACPSLLWNPKVQVLKASRILYVDKGECPLAKDDVIIHTISYKNTLNAYYLVRKQ